MQRALGDGDVIKPKMLKQGQMESLEGDVRDAAVSDVGNRERGREAQGRRRQRYSRPTVAQVQLLEVIQGRGPETGVHGRSVVLGVPRGNAEAAAGTLVGGKDA